MHDYAGHPFQVQLSRELAGRGHTVLHAYSDAIVSPRGALTRRPGDAAQLTIRAIGVDAAIRKSAYFHRYFQELRYGHRLAAAVAEFQPDVVVSANTPLEAQSAALRATHKGGASFIFWLQDIQSVGFERMLRARLGIAGILAARRFAALERGLLTRSDHVVTISPDFLEVLDGFGVLRGKTSVIENWASILELPVRARDNAWAAAHGLCGKFCFLYSGTLGLKHNPDLLIQLAQCFHDDPEVAVVVISEGEVADLLHERKRSLGLENLRLLPFQPYEDLPDVMGSADVLVALLEADAGVFSVPSKVLSYLCAGRALLLAVPDENLAARIVVRSGAGLVAPPGDTNRFLALAARLRGDSQLRASMAAAALGYAATTFDLERIVDRFEAVIAAAQATRGA